MGKINKRNSKLDFLSVAIVIKGNFSCPGNAGELGLWRAWLCSSTSAKNYRKTEKFGQTTLF